MVTKLRKKFIAAAMIAVSAVLVTIIGILNVVNYINVERTSDAKLALLVETGGSFFPMNGMDHDDMPFDGKEEAAMPDVSGKDRRFSAETPYEMRYFTVTVSDEGVTAVDVGRIAAVDETKAKEYAQALYSSGKNKGRIDDYKYVAVDKGNGKMYVFLDCDREYDECKTILFYSILISALGLGVVAVLIVLISKVFVRPLADGYEKQKRFITDASHELKTPLTIISANTEILEMDVGENEWTTSIRNQVARLTDMTNKLVYLARMEEENPHVNMIDFSLSNAVAEAAEPYKAIALSSGKTLNIDVDENVTYKGDEKAIRQALTMLLDNAMKYSDEKGTVWVSLKSVNSGKEIVVKNTVDKIATGKHDELFDRFVRGDESRNSKTGGSGIGMSVAHAIVAAHKGKISAKSEDGKSLTITIIL